MSDLNDDLVIGSPSGAMAAMGLGPPQLQGQLPLNPMFYAINPFNYPNKSLQPYPPTIIPNYYTQILPPMTQLPGTNARGSIENNVTLNHAVADSQNICGDAFESRQFYPTSMPGMSMAYLVQPTQLQLPPKPTQSNATS